MESLIFVLIVIGIVAFFIIKNKTIPEGDQKELEKLYGDLEAKLAVLEKENSLENLAGKLTARIVKQWRFVKENDELYSAIKLAAFELIHNERIFKLPKIDFSKKLIFAEILDYKKWLTPYEEIISDFGGYFNQKFLPAAVELFGHILQHLAPFPVDNELPIHFETELLTSVHPLAKAVDDLVKAALEETPDEYRDFQTPTEDVLFITCYRIRKHFETAGEIWPADRKNSNKTPQELIKTYLYMTPFWDLLYSTNLPFTIPDKKRAEHTHIIGGTGHGKTQLLQNLIFNDLYRAYEQDTPFGLCIIDSQGDLINTLLRLRYFDHSQEGLKLINRLVYINPDDIDYPPCLNLFDLNLGKIKNPTRREMVVNSTISLYQYIFSDLVEGKLTMYQENIFQNCAKLLLTIEDATFLTFIDILTDISRFEKYYPRLDATTRGFFQNEFKSTLYSATRQQLLARLRRIATNTTFRRMFDNPRNKVDMFEAMNSGKIVFINTSKMLLQSDGAKMLGKFFIVLILQSVFQRAFLKEHQRRPFMVYIDEAQDYLTEILAEFFDQARKYNVGLTVAHQHLKQLDRVSPALKHSVLVNTSVKLVGNTGPDDARALAERIFVSKEEILNLRKWDKRASEFYCFIKDITRRAVKVRVPFGELNERSTASEKEVTRTIQRNRDKYCRYVGKRGPLGVEAEDVSPAGPGKEPSQMKNSGQKTFKVGKRKSF